MCLQVQKVLERLQPVCRWFTMKYCPWDFVVPITNCVTFDEEYNLTDAFCGQEIWDQDIALACLSSLKKVF